MVQELQRAQESVKKFGSKVADVGKKAAVLYAVVKAVTAIKDASTGIVSTAASYESLGVSMESAFGSAEVAARRFQELKKFAAETPYSLADVTEAAIIMRNRGLDPAIGSIESMGNTASSMNKPLLQFVEAIADAATLQMDRLAEFGIVAAQQGDKVKFTFQGVTTEVGRNAEEIQKYLLSIGNTNFAGGMEKQAQTLSGMFSTFQDAVSNLSVAFAEKSGLAKSVKEATARFTELINTLTVKIEQIGEAPTIEDLTKKIEEHNRAIKVNNDNYILSIRQREKANKTHLEEIELLRHRIEAKQELADKERKIIEDQEKQEEEAKAKRLAQTQAEADAKAAEDNKKKEDGRLNTLFGGDWTEKLGAIEEQFASETQLIQDKKIEQLATLENLRAEELLSEQRFWQLSRQVKTKAYNDEQKLIEDKEKKKEMAIKRGQAATLTATASFLGMLGQKNKGFAIAEAVMNTYLGVSRTLAAYPFPYNLAPAALHLAQGVAQVSAIRSGGGASVPSGGSVPDLPTVDGVTDLAANDEPRTTKTITVAFEGEGELLPRSVLRELADELNSLDDSNVRISV
jgi:hypothetical protein